MKIKLEPNDGLFLISPRRSPFGHLRGGFRRVICRLLPVAWKCGFTLLELLVVISIIGILAGFGAVSFTTAQKKGRDAKRQADMKQIQSALEQCYSIQTSYPTAAWTSGSLTCDSQTVATIFPEDPKNSGDYTYTYNYYDTTNGDGYCICALLEQGAGNVSALPSGSSFACSFGTGSNYFCVQNLQ